MKEGTILYFNNVLKEIINLKKYATQEELDNLNINKLIPDLNDNCIYGQLTGNCFSERATRLIIKCCTSSVSFDTIKSEETTKYKPREDNRYTYSFLEHCINTYCHNNTNIIAFLKSEINTITLTKQ